MSLKSFFSVFFINLTKRKKMAIYILRRKTMTLSIAQIKEILTNSEVDEHFITQLRQDDRKGVQALIKKYDREKEKQEALKVMHERMTRYERSMRDKGYRLIAGIDEVGRGPLAGPVVASAVILPESFQLLGLTDSKKLPKKKREQFAEIIKKEAIAYSIQFISASEIDQINIYEATKKAMILAVKKLQTKPDVLLVDAMELPIAIAQHSLNKGDEKSISIAASSVLAKVARDEYMEQLESRYPGYGFKDHVGYGTKEHLKAVAEIGVTEEHRRSFRPIRELALEKERGSH